MTATTVIAELLRLPARSQTVLPELIDFFKDDPEQLTKFLREFSGTTFVIPGPNLWSELQRDEQIGLSLMRAPSIENQIRLCTTERVTYAHLKEVYEIVAGKRLPPPPNNGTLAARTDEVKRLTALYPKASKLIREIYGFLGKGK